jgi:hypothetical protein
VFFTPMLFVGERFTVQKLVTIGPFILFSRTIRLFLIRTLSKRGRYSARKIESMSRPSHNRRAG